MQTEILHRSNTPLVSNWKEDSEHHRPKRPANRPSMVYYGPITFGVHEVYQQNRETTNEPESKSVNNNSTAIKEKAKYHSHSRVSDVIAVILTASLAFELAIPLGLLAYVLIESFTQSLHNTLHALHFNFTADASNIETNAFFDNAFSSVEEVELPSNSSTLLEYARMAIYPFMLFVPSFLLFSHLIIGMISGNQSWKTMTAKVVLSFVSLFALMETMLALAYASKWTLLGITSAFPLLMMILARVSISSAIGVDAIASCDKNTPAEEMDSNECIISQTSAAVASAIVLTTFFTTILLSSTLTVRNMKSKRRFHTLLAALSISEAIALTKEWYKERSILLFISEMLGFLFIFLPFTAGVFHLLLEPFYILSGPLSSLAICTIAGLSPISLIGLILSILLVFIGTNMLYLTLVTLYRIYLWLTHRHLTLLVCAAWLAIIFTEVLK